MYDGKSWNIVNINQNQKIDLGISEYEMNKMIISQLPDLDEIQLNNRIELIDDYTHSHINTPGYYMLLCNELKYYTVFIVDDDYMENAADVVIECLETMGHIKEICYNEDKTALECWIQDFTNEIHMFMLFNYEWGIVLCQ